MQVQYTAYRDATSVGHPQLARAGDLVFVGGQMAAHPERGMPPEAKLLPGYPWHGSAIEKQLTYLYGELDSTLKDVGSSLRQVMKINSYHVEPSEIDMALRLRKDWFGEAAPPPSTLVLCPELPIQGPTVLIDMITLADDAGHPRRPVNVKKIPAIGHVAALGWAAYLQACKGGGFVFTAGKAASRDRGPIPEAQQNPEFPYRHHQIRLQTEFVLEELKSVLSEAGCGLEDVVRAEVHLTDIRDLAGLDAVWRRYFPEDPPARVVVPLEMAAPAYQVEVEFICVDPDGPYEKESLRVADLPLSLSPEAQAVRAGPYVFLSGQLATDWRHGVAPQAAADENFPYHSSPVKRQAEFVLDNVESLCQAAGTSTQHLVKRRVHHRDLNDMAEAEEVWTDRLEGRMPPTSVFRTHSDLPVPGCAVQYDLIAFIP